MLCFGPERLGQPPPGRNAPPRGSLLAPGTAAWRGSDTLGPTSRAAPRASEERGARPQPRRRSHAHARLARIRLFKLAPLERASWAGALKAESHTEPPSPLVARARLVDVSNRERVSVSYCRVGHMQSLRPRGRIEALVEARGARMVKAAGVGVQTGTTVLVGWQCVALPNARVRARGAVQASFL
eukprot:6046247-Prymnesium_polylepis.2